MKKLLSVFLFSLLAGGLGGTPAFAQSCVELIAQMKEAAPKIEDQGKRAEFQALLAAAEQQLKAFQYVDCVATGRKAMAMIKK